jgi:Domain of unknown function (DU1801)
MFRVDVDSLQAYLDFDPKRKKDLLKLHATISKAAPGLKRHFHAGTPEGHAGMRFKMIGYGRYHYTAGTGEKVAWPVIGVALQKNYISVYVSVTKNGKSIVGTYAGKLGAQRSGDNNFSFESFDDLDERALSSLFAEIGRIFNEDPDNPVRYRQGGN